MDSRELEIIWQNTVRYRTAASEIAVMSDLYNGLEKSGYQREQFQRYDHLHNCTEFIVFDREELEEVLMTLEQHRKISFDEKWIGTRMGMEVYHDMKNIKYPSGKITSADIKENPFLLTLLIGELSKHDYFDSNIIQDHKNNEIYLQVYGIEGDPLSYRKRNLSQDEAMETVLRIGQGLEKLILRADSSCIERKGSRLVISGHELYEITEISYPLIKIRNMEERLKTVNDQKAKDSIIEGIKKHKQSMGKKEGAYFPCFRIIQV